MAQSITQNEALMKRIVIGLGVLLVLGAVGLVVAIILKPIDEPTPTVAPGVSVPAMPAVPAMPDATMQLPPLNGREIVETTVDGTTLTLRVQDAAGAQEIWIIDMASGAVIRKFSFSPDP